VKKASILALRVLLAVVLLGLLGAQGMYFPTLADQMAQSYPELAWMQWPMLAVVVLGILATQIAVVAVWVLLSMVESERVFSAKAFGWVDVIIAACALDAVLVLGIGAYLTFGIHACPPSLLLLLSGLAVGGATVAVLMVVMKGLLRQASTMQSELSEVI